MKLLINRESRDVLRLTARYAAVRGSSFLVSLSQKEWNNTQFDFLKPNNALYPYFMRIVQQYTSLIREPISSPEQELRENVRDPYSLLSKIQPRVRWQSHMESQKKKQKEEAEKEKCKCILRCRNWFRKSNILHLPFELELTCLSGICTN